MKSIGWWVLIYLENSGLPDVCKVLRLVCNLLHEVCKVEIYNQSKKHRVCSVCFYWEIRLSLYAYRHTV